jgi:hypothetical protein
MTMKDDINPTQGRKYLPSTRIFAIGGGQVGANQSSAAPLEIPTDLNV